MAPEVWPVIVPVLVVAVTATVLLDVKDLDVVVCVHADVKIISVVDARVVEDSVVPVALAPVAEGIVTKLVVTLPLVIMSEVVLVVAVVEVAVSVRAQGSGSASKRRTLALLILSTVWFSQPNFA